MKGESESGLRVLGCDEWEQFGDGLIERFSASRLGCAQQLLEFGPGFIDVHHKMKYFAVPLQKLQHTTGSLPTCPLSPEIFGRPGPSERLSFPENAAGNSAREMCCALRRPAAAAGASVKSYNNQLAGTLNGYL